jgi:KaiC/GvpD/RAD55 family RecA-like ATPase
MAFDDRLFISPLPFGIPQLDQLLGYEDLPKPHEDPPKPPSPGGEKIEERNDILDCLRENNSLAIVGRDGTGKSVFALHLASMYHALHFYGIREKLLPDDLISPPLVVYISSDLRWKAAEKIWQNFFLDYPWLRYVPFVSPRELDFRRNQIIAGETLEIKLARHSPGEKPGSDHGRTLRGFLSGTGAAPESPNERRRERQVCFLDLASETMGDDWLFVARLLASVPRLPNAPPNLLVVDSMAGFETLVGERNSFGEEMTRRARVAQIVRAAGKSWHTVLVVEEPDPGEHNPEEYVTDTVIHLRREGRAERSRRTMEIEKSRARSVGIGEHPFDIRDGRGSSTRSWENPDDPHTLLHGWTLDEKNGIGKQIREQERNPYNAYVQIFPSLHFLSKDFTSSTRVATPVERPLSVVPFDIPYLDNMLAKQGEDKGGLPQGSVTCLVGDEGTLKASLAEQFLAEAFTDFDKILDLTLTLALDFQKNYARRVRLSEYLQNEAARRVDAAAKLEPDLANRFKEGFKTLTRWLDDSRHRQLELDHAAKKKWRLKSPGELVKDLDDAHLGPLKTRWDTTLHYKEVTPPEKESTPQHLILALSILRTSCGLLTPVVFVSTHDTAAEKISEMIFKARGARIRDCLTRHGINPGENKPNAENPVESAIRRLLERFILVRRVELIDETAPQLWQIIQDSGTHALYLMGHKVKDIFSAVDPVPLAGGIRVVVSDLRLIRDTYPEVASDPLFLPTLVFRLRRMGVTSLIVDSDTGRPDRFPTHPMNGALRSLVDHQIYTWKVPFFGEQRVAITVIPLAVEQAAVIRELKFKEPVESGTSLQRDPAIGKLDVDPHFELYMGVEEGKPAAVPLRVVFYAETEAFEKYVQGERELLERMFTSVDHATPIVQVKKRQDYEALRDYCHLPSETRLPYSLVFMVDGYWALRRDTSLMNQAAYLNRSLEDSALGEQEREDSLRLFRRTVQQQRHTDWKARGQFFAQRRDISKGDTPNNYYYHHRFPRGTEVSGITDRIPFTWDFGFLLCKRKLWENAADIGLPGNSLDRVHCKVKSVWDDLLRLYPDAQPQEEQAGTVDGKAGKRKTSPPKTVVGGGGYVRWREFFGACTVVARTEERRRGSRVPAFDLSFQTPDSLISLILEIWLSEIAGDALRMARFAQSPGVGKSDPHGLRKFAREWSKEAMANLEKASGFEIASDDSVIQFQKFLRGEGRSSSVDKSVLRSAFEKMKTAFSNMPKMPRSPTLGDYDKRYARLLQASADGTVDGKTGYAFQLFKTWLLLMEVLDIRDYLDPERPFELRSGRPSSADAPATREWYRTACDPTSAGGPDEYNLRTPVRLPGHFSVRAGWFLAVARGSRSRRLAERALDLLSSRRANRTRLHLGLGLPTRDILEGPTAGHIRTALTVRGPDGDFPVVYGDLLAIGATRELSPIQNTSFHWLFRSAFRDYDRQTPVIGKWIHRLFEWSVQYRHAHRHTWRGGFQSYDELDHGNLETVGAYPSFRMFAAAVDEMVEDLNAATLVGASPRTATTF